MPARVLRWTVALLAGAALAAPAARAAESMASYAVVGALQVTDEQPLSAMIQLLGRRPDDDRAGLRALVSGLPPEATVEIRGFQGGCQRRGGDDLWSGAADGDGVLSVGISEPQAVTTSMGLDYTHTAVVWSEPFVFPLDPEMVCVPSQAVRVVRPGSLPEVVLATLTDWDALTLVGIVAIDIQRDGKATVTTLFAGPDAGDYRLAIARRPGNAMNIVNLSLGWDALLTRQDVQLDEQTLRAIARNDTDVVLFDDELTALASSQVVKVGKLLGVNY